MKKDKLKVTEEVLSDEKIKRFLDYRPYDQSSVDHHILLTAIGASMNPTLKNLLASFKPKN